MGHAMGCGMGNGHASARKSATTIAKKSVYLKHAHYLFDSINLTSQD
jgi:hypothetical protein